MRIKAKVGETIMKSVLISTQPKWCEIIANGEKTIEVRKTKPKLETPFKVYIYCTNPRHYVDSKHCFSYPKEPLWKTENKGLVQQIDRECGKTEIINGKVIGEFVCDYLDDFSDFPYDYGALLRHLKINSCVDYMDLEKYLEGKKKGYGWHISNPILYDRPKELGEFNFPPEKFCEKELCGNCPLYETPSYEYGDVMHDCEWKRPITRAPQSWCYVEELEDYECVKYYSEVKEQITANGLRDSI